jgi:sulfate transport system ATP-binding protein
MSVVVKDVGKRFTARGTPAVDGVSFTAPKGAITTLLGPSGSGKTTLLRILAGLETPDHGSIEVDGVDWTKLPARRRRIGLVFQSYALFQHMTVAKNIAFGLEAQRVPKREIAPRVRELLELVQLGALGDRYPAQLSGGQQQRVAFARALAPRPSLLLLDEPFGALDAHVRVELRRWLSELHEATQVTTILVTHDQDEALEISQQIVVVSGGRIAQCGTPREVYEHPATPFVASFVGSATRLSGRVAGGRASVGAAELEAPQGAIEGAVVAAYVRPHDVRIVRAHDGTGELATIVRISRVGGRVKVNLKLANGDAIAVELGASEAEALGVRDGDSVRVEVARAKVFVEPDYSI